jgi:hypothetical protein
MSGSETTVRPVDGRGLDPHQQLVGLRSRFGDLRSLHDLWRAVPSRNRRLHRREVARPLKVGTRAEGPDVDLPVVCAEMCVAALLPAELRTGACRGA